MKEAIVKLLKEALAKKKINLKEEEIEKFIEVPPSSEMGDYAFPCFFLVKTLKQEPSQIALEIREKITAIPDGFEDIQTSGPYINFILDRKTTALNLLQEILSKKENFGKTDSGKSKKTMIEFSQPNTHKAFHVGHIRGTSLGESLSRISEFNSEKVIRANYSGDTGMHIAKWIWCYKKYHSKEKLKNNELWIASIYTDAVKRLAKNKNLQLQVDEINRKIGTRENKKINELWKKTRKMSIDSWKKIYKELNTKFDVNFFESELESDGLKIVDELLAKKIAELSEGAVIINLNKCGLGVWVLLRKDKTVLYSTKDIALARKKFEEFKIDKNIYVVGAEQSLHMRQLFKTLEIMGIKEADKCKHVPFSEVRLPTGKMSSRTGENILYSDFIKEITDYAKKEIKKRIPEISKTELEKRALKISIAAIKYSMLKQTPNKNIIFNKHDALNFEGDTGPYVLYSYARASSILRKSKTKLKKVSQLDELEEKEVDLIKKLSQFPEVVFNAYTNLNPSVIANYSYHLAQIFNEFYHACPVIGSENQEFRLLLVEAFRQVLKNSTFLLGIDVVERM